MVLQILVQAFRGKIAKSKLIQKPTTGHKANRSTFRKVIFTVNLKYRLLLRHKKGLAILGYAWHSDFLSFEIIIYLVHHKIESFSENSPLKMNTVLQGQHAAGIGRVAIVKRATIRMQAAANFSSSKFLPRMQADDSNNAPAFCNWPRSCPWPKEQETQQVLHSHGIGVR